MDPLNPNRPWRGPRYRPRESIFVLGESYAGSYDGEAEYDDFYFAQCLAGERNDPLFSALCEKLGMPASRLWEQIMFTNMAMGSIGPNTQTVVTQERMNAGRPRLHMLMLEYAPRGVLCLGRKTGVAAKPVLNELGIPWRDVRHPSGKNERMGYPCTPEMLRSAWCELGGAL